MRLTRVRAFDGSDPLLDPLDDSEITEIAYQPGQPVTTGQVLFRLDDDQLAATLSAAAKSVQATTLAAGWRWRRTAA